MCGLLRVIELINVPAISRLCTYPNPLIVALQLQRGRAQRYKEQLRLSLFTRQEEGLPAIPSLMAVLFAKTNPLCSGEEWHLCFIAHPPPRSWSAPQNCLQLDVLSSWAIHFYTHSAGGGKVGAKKRDEERESHSLLAFSAFTICLESCCVIWTQDLCTGESFCLIADRYHNAPDGGGNDSYAQKM